MNCPSCNQELTPKKITGVPVQACEGSCGGLWFDRTALKKLKERNPGTGADLLHVERADGVHVFRNVHHPCPRCVSTLLYRHCFNKPLGYEIDQCSKCAGFWLDVGTLAQLPEDAGSAQSAARVYFKNLFEENLKPEILAHPDTLEASRTILKLYRFLTPPNLFPSKTSLDAL